MLVSIMRGRIARIATLVVPIAFAGCGASSTTASCEDFTSEYATFGNPKVTEMVSDAYFEKFSDRESVSGGTLMANMTRVRQGCDSDPQASIDEFIEVSD